MSHLNNTTKNRKGKYLNYEEGTSIIERQKIAETREEYGHWEMDTVVVGKRKRKRFCWC